MCAPQIVLIKSKPNCQHTAQKNQKYDVRQIKITIKILKARLLSLVATSKSSQNL